MCGLRLKIVVSKAWRRRCNYEKSFTGLEVCVCVFESVRERDVCNKVVFERAVC